MSLEDQVLHAVRAAMPANAQIRVIHGFDPEVCVSWKIDDDPGRPNKMSKTILLIISHEAVQDFASASAALQKAAHGRVLAFLNAKLAQFDPGHNTPRCESPPVENWVITSEVVLG